MPSASNSSFRRWRSSRLMSYWSDGSVLTTRRITTALPVSFSTPQTSGSSITSSRSCQTASATRLMTYFAWSMSVS